MDSLHKFPLLHQATDQLHGHCFGGRQDPEELAAVALAIFERLLAILFPILGTTGSLALFRRSLKLTQDVFPCYQDARTAEDGDLLTTLGGCLRRDPHITVEASLALLKTFVELLATFIGERLTRQLLQDAWPDILSFPSEETQQ